VLAEHANKDGDFKTTAREIVAYAPKNKHRKTYEAENLHFNYTCDDSGLIFLCVTTPDDEKKLAWVFLPHIRHQFLLEHASFDPDEVPIKRSSAITYCFPPPPSSNKYEEMGMEDEFGPVLRDEMKSFNENPLQDKVNQLRKEVGEVTTILKESIQEFENNNAARVEHLQRTTGKLAPTSAAFYKDTKKNKCKTCMKNICCCSCCLTIFCCCK